MLKKLKIWIDEAGRGPWLGPVVACSLCFLDKSSVDKKLLNQINDSKKLTKKKREELYKLLIDLSLWDNPKLVFWVWVVDNFIIDEINIKQANKEAMRRSLVEILRKIDQLKQKKSSLSKGRGIGEVFDVRKRNYKLEVLIDWRDNYEFEELDKKPIYIVWWDSKVLEIWASSIIAKVFRDKLIKTYSSLYPEFSLDKHQGYGTKKHREYLKNPSKITGIHRLSYKPVKKVLKQKQTLLLHICCWPDASIPIKRLKDKFDLLCFWYDPNIQPKKEYNKRLKAFKKVCKLEKVKFIEWKYDDKEFFKKVVWLEKEPEKWKRCTICYNMRLSETKKLAKKLKIKYFSTVLTISPHKNTKKIFELWKFLSDKDIIFIDFDFKKENGFLESIKYSKNNNIYRQNYCWCIFSKK